MADQQQHIDKKRKVEPVVMVVVQKTPDCDNETLTFFPAVSEIQDLSLTLFDLPDFLLDSLQELSKGDSWVACLVGTGNTLSMQRKTKRRSFTWLTNPSGNPCCPTLSD